MKKILFRRFNLITIYFIMLFMASQTYSSNDDYESKVKKLAAVKVIKEKIIELGNHEFSDLESYLSEQMSAKPDVYSLKDYSRDFFKEYFINKNNELISQYFKSVYDEFSDGGNAFSIQWLSSYADDNFTVLKNQVMTQNIEKYYFPAFDRSRRSVVEEQWKNLAFDSYPEIHEVEKIIEQGNFRQQVETRLLQDILAKRSLFIENINRIKDAISKAIDDALIQFTDQKNVIQASDGSNYMTQKRISVYLADSVKTYINSVPLNTGRKVYPMFPSIQGAIPTRSDEIVKIKLGIFINSNEVEDFIPANLISSYIQQDIVKHKYPARSRELLRTLLIPDFTNSVIKIYSQKARQIDGDDSEFNNWIEWYLSKDKEGSGIIGIRCDSILDKSAPLVRNQISKQQLTEYFNTIYTKQLEIPEKIIVEYYRKKTSIDINELPNIFPRIFPIDNFNQKKDRMLQESLHELEDALNGEHSLLTEGEAALLDQIKLIDNNINSDDDKIKNAIQKYSEDRQNSSLDNLFGIFQNKWNEDRIKKGKKKYLALFEYSKEKIKNLINKSPTEVKTEPVSQSGSGGGNGGGLGNGYGPGSGNVGKRGEMGNCNCDNEKKEIKKLEEKIIKLEDELKRIKSENKYE